jgi:hypothetical protein
VCASASATRALRWGKGKAVLTLPGQGVILIFGTPPAHPEGVPKERFQAPEPVHVHVQAPSMIEHPQPHFLVQVCITLIIDSQTL